METDERDAAIRRRYYAGRSAIGLGVEYGLSRSQVHRIVAAGSPEERDDEGWLAVLAADPYEPTPPFTFCRTETVLVVVGKGDEPSTQESERWLDANGRSCSVLDLWRWVTHRDGEGDYDAADRVRADIERQRAAWAER